MEQCGLALSAWTNIKKEEDRWQNSRSHIFSRKADPKESRSCRRDENNESKQMPGMVADTCNLRRMRVSHRTKSLRPASSQGFSRLCACVHVDTHTHVPRGWRTMSSSISFYFIFLRQGLSLNLEFIRYGRLAGQWAVRIHLPLSTLYSHPISGLIDACHYVWLLLCGFWGSGLRFLCLCGKFWLTKPAVPKTKSLRKRTMN